MAREMLRVLRPGGVFIMVRHLCGLMAAQLWFPDSILALQITYGDPGSRLFVLERLKWDISVHLAGASLSCCVPLLFPALTPRRHCPAAKTLSDRKPGSPPAFIGPLHVSGDEAWESALKGLTMDEYHYIYVCRKL